MTDNANESLVDGEELANGDIQPTFTSLSRSRSPIPDHQNGVGVQGYEEFFGGTIACPSCRGTGRIPQDRENELVALIPVNDKRLKPRRTTLYVFLAVSVCLLIGGLLAYFLFPRGIRLGSNSPTLKPTFLYVNTTEEVIKMTIVNEYNISNSNYYSVFIQNMSVSLTFDTHIIAQAINTTYLRVPLRSTTPYSVTINVTFAGDEGYMAHYCGGDIRRTHTILLPFQATLKSAYFGGVLENSLLTYQHVRCNNRAYSNW